MGRESNVRESPRHTKIIDRCVLAVTVIAQIAWHTEQGRGNGDVKAVGEHVLGATNCPQKTPSCDSRVFWFRAEAKDGGDISVRLRSSIACFDVKSRHIESLRSTDLPFVEPDCGQLLAPESLSAFSRRVRPQKAAWIKMKRHVVSQANVGGRPNRADVREAYRVSAKDGAIRVHQTQQTFVTSDRVREQNDPASAAEKCCDGLRHLAVERDEIPAPTKKDDVIIH